MAAATFIVVVFNMSPAGARDQTQIRQSRPRLLRSERSQCVLSAGAAHPNLRDQALLARCRHRSAAGRPQFTDYAFPPAIGYPSFARENNNRPIDRQPLNPPSDMGGYPQSFPLY